MIEKRRKGAMADRVVVLINANVMKPPVAPLALDYIGDRLRRVGVTVTLLDLSFVDDTQAAVFQALDGTDAIAVGVSFRNSDDCFWPSGETFVPQFRELIDQVRAATPAPIVVGGCGFSIFPIPIMERCNAELGIVGDGEEAMLQLVRQFEAGDDYRNVPGLIYHGNDNQLVLNPPRYGRLLDVPPERSLVDNARYFREGAMGNVETKRGCPMKCIYCADPVAKGQFARCRDPRQVADEVELLLRQGVDVLHLCDGEFNIPPQHALAVCEEFIARRLGERVRWYCYASVSPFPTDLARAMRQAGCVGVNIGADSGSNRMLDVLERGYHRDAITETVSHCRNAELTIMIDLLLGGPGEDEDSVRETIKFVKDLEPDRCGAATGIRLYPGTPLTKTIRNQGPLIDNPHLHGHLEDNDNLLRPVFYIDRQLGDDAGELVCDIIGGDKRFFPPPRARDATNYNYNDNTVLIDAIATGHRGAFWDILRQIA